MLNDFENISLHRKFERLVRPRSDWFGLNYIEKALAYVIPKIVDLGAAFPEHNSIVQICTEHQLHEHIEPAAKQQGVSGLKTEYPQHAALYELGRTKAFEEKRIVLAARVIVIADDWIQQLQEEYSPRLRDQLDARLDDVWRAIRLLTDQGLELIPEPHLDISEFVSSLNTVLSGLDERYQDDLGQQANYLFAVRRFFADYAGRGREFHYRLSTRSASQALNLERKRISPVEPGGNDPEGELSPFCTSQQATVRERQELRRCDHYKEGNAPEEVEDGPRMDVSEHHVDVSSGDNLRGAMIRRKHQLIHQKRAAQTLPGSWNSLNEDEIRQLAKRLLPGQSELAATVTLMLITGRDFHEVRKARVAHDKAQVPQKLKPSQLIIIDNDKNWVTGIQSPAERRKIKSRWRDVLINPVGLLQFSIPRPFWNLLRKQVRAAAGRAQSRSVELFKEPDEKVAADLDGLLRELRAKRRTRITSHRLAHQLYWELVFETGDQVEATMVTGRHAPFGASAALYYHHVETQLLAASYQSVVQKWAKLFERDYKPERKHLELFSERCGSNLVPEDWAVKDFLSALRAQIEYDRILLGTAEGLRHFHNSFTAYVVMMLFWLTGYRAVKDPVSAPSEFSLIRGFLMIADKTGDGYGYTRTVPICDTLSAQIEYYKQHQHYINSALGVTAPEHDQPFFYFLNQNLQWQSVEPKSLSDQIGWATDLPHNISRHWLRGALREQQVPADYVNAFMGHWCSGREPWSRYSALDPFDFSRQLSAALERLAQTIKALPVEGIS